MEIFNIFMNNMVSVEATNWFAALPMVVPCVQTNVVWFYHRSEWTSEGYQDSFIRFIAMAFTNERTNSLIYNHGPQKIWKQINK